MKESYCIVDKRVTPCTEPSGYQNDKRGRTQFFCHCAVCGIKKVRYVKSGSVSQTGSGKKRKTKKKSKKLISPSVMAGKGVGDAVGPIKTGINIGQKISETLFPQTKQTFKDYWSGYIAKGAFNSEDGVFTSNFWTGKTTVFRYDGKKFYLKEGEPIMVVKKNGKQIGYAHVKDFFSGGLGTNKIYKSVAEVKNKYGSGLFDTAAGTAVDGFVHYGLPWMSKKAVEMGRYYSSEALRNPKLQKKAVDYTLDKLNPMIQNVGSQALNQLSTKIRPKKNYKTNRKDLDGGAIDIHKAVGKLPKPARGWTLPGHKYTGPYNDLENQVRYNPETGEILEIYDQPTGPTDAVSMQHDVDYSVCGNDRKCKNKADKKMVKSLDAIPWKKRQWGHTLARTIINTKQKLGLGLNASRR